MWTCPGGTGQLLKALECGDGTEAVGRARGLRAGIWWETDSHLFKALDFYFPLVSTDSYVLISNFLREVGCTYGVFFKTTLIYYTYAQHIYRETQKALLHRHTHTSTHITSYTYPLSHPVLGVSFLCISVHPHIFFCPDTPE